MGQRIAKTVTNKNTIDGTDKFVTTYYVRDPQGNVLAVYEHKHGDSDNGTFTLTEQHLYGASRLGMKKRDLALNVANASESTTPVTHYELTNHLGNVMAVISDEASATAEPTVVSLTDYYPFGMTEPGRSWNAGAEGYRYGFNTQENVPELGEGHTTALYWEYDGRLGRRWNLDPVFKPMKSSYCTYSNNPIDRIDINGDDDFFDLEGNFLFHTNTELNYVRVMNSEQLFFSQTDANFNLNMVRTITSFDYCDDSNARMLYKIMAYYTEPLNLPTVTSLVSFPNIPDAAAYTSPADKSVSLTEVDGVIHRTCDISDQLISTIIHEGVHTTQDLQNYNLLMECPAILTQMEYEDSKKVTLEFHDGHAEYYRGSLNRYYRKMGHSVIDDIVMWVNKFNEYAGYEYFVIDENQVNEAGRPEIVNYSLPDVTVTADDPSKER